LKKLRRVASATVLATFMMTGIVPTLAADTQNGTMQNGTKTNPYIDPVVEPSIPEGMLTKEQAIAKVKTMFGKELGQLKMTSAIFEEHSFLDVPSWEISFANYDIGEKHSDSKLLEQIHVAIHAKTGVLVKFNHLNPAWQGSHFPYDDVAEAAADRFLDLYAPDYHKDFKSNGVRGTSRMSSGGSTGKHQEWSSSTLQYVEQVNGIPFPKNGLQFDVDEHGNVIDFYASTPCDVATLPAPDGVLAMEKAETMYGQQDPMSKIYLSALYSSTQTGTKEPDPRLLYVPTDYFKMIDAFTGQPVTQSYMRNQPMLHEDVPLTSSGEWVPKSKEDITKQVEQILQLDLSDYKVRETNQAAAGIWEYQWSKENEGKGERSVQARFDAKTGNLLYLQKFGDQTNGQPQLTVEEGQQKAQELLEKVLPKGQQDLMLVHSTDSSEFSQAPSWYKPNSNEHIDNMGQNFYLYDFSYAHQGVPILDQNISVQIDRTTGQLVSLHLTPTTDVQLPDNVGTVTPQVAEAAYLKDHPLHLEYEWDQYSDQFAPQGELVYVPDYDSTPSTYVDAFTGKTVELRRDGNK
jgi:hypothetical protein